jgi:hypothetical protein
MVPSIPACAEETKKKDMKRPKKNKTLKPYIGTNLRVIL